MKTKLFFLLLTLLILGESVKSQWQSDLRLTNEATNSYTSSSNGRCIAASGNILHVVWYDYRDANYEIYYKRSTNGGTTWSSDTRLTIWTFNSTYPSVSVSGSNVHVVWQDERFGNVEIFYKRSTDAGLTWSTDVRLTNSSGVSSYPSMAVSGSNVQVVWEDNRDGYYQIYYKRSTDGGSNWGMDYRMTSSSNNSDSPNLTTVGFVVHVVWSDIRDGNREIYYRRSQNSGSSWGPETRLTNNANNSYEPSVDVSGQDVHVAWYDDRPGNDEIFYKRSTDGGSNWGMDNRMTYDNEYSLSPVVTASGEGVYILWYDFRDVNWEIYYRRSTNGGSSFASDTRLTNNSSSSWYPFAAISGSDVHVVWCDHRDGNWEIYYKKNPTGNPVGITGIGSEIPEHYSLSQNYPNPFNPSTTMKFALTKAGIVTLKVYDMAGREVASLINDNLNAGTYEYNFDASHLSSGAYFYKITADGFTDVKKMMLVK